MKLLSVQLLHNFLLRRVFLRLTFADEMEVGVRRYACVSFDLWENLKAA